MERDSVRSLAPIWGGEQLHHVAGQAFDVGRLRADRDLTGLQLGEVQDVVDQAHQGAAGVVDAAQVVAGRGGDVGLGHGQVGEADDAGERRSELVAHVGQEVGLDRGGFLGGDQGGALFGDVLEHAVQQGGVAVGVHGAGALGDDAARAAVLAGEVQLQLVGTATGDGGVDGGVQADLIGRGEEAHGLVELRVEIGAGDAVDLIDLVGPEDAAGRHLDAPVTDAAEGLGHVEHVLLLATAVLRAGAFQLGHDQLGQGCQLLQLSLRGAGAGHGVDDAQGAEIEPRRRGQKRAGVEADAGLAGHQRIVAEARVEGGVLDHHDAARRQFDGQVAEGVLARGRAGIQPHAAQQPLGVVVDQIDRGHGAVEQGRRHLGRASQHRAVERVALPIGANFDLAVGDGHERDPGGRVQLPTFFLAGA